MKRFPSNSWVSISLDDQQLLKARWCVSFFCQLRGLMFRRHLAKDDGLLLVQSTPGRVNAAIHMWMMNFDLAVFWLDEQNRVVDKVIARRGRVYLPKIAAKIVLEAHVDQFERIPIGSQLRLEAYTASD